MNEQKFSKLLRPWLDASAQKLNYRTVHRLEVGRKAAINAIGSAVLNGSVGTSTNTNTMISNSGSLLMGGGDQDRWSIWNKLSIGFSALVLVVGMFAISDWRAETDAEESAVEVAQLLTDDLPLTAYADHGFGVFMKNTRQESSGE